MSIEKEIGHKLYPFTAIVGQDQVKRALLLNVICPQIGGVLLSGQKGTAKSTIVRALGDLLPNKEVITLPLNATEDRILGSIDLEKALQSGEQHFEAGILAKAHNQILYIDEVNLLSESLVNTILDVAASGVNRVEREGISHEHPCRFILVGTMNPEEGGLKPQLLDRFGFFVDVNASDNIRERVEIISQRLAYEANPQLFCKQQKEKQEILLDQINRAENKLKGIDLDDHVLQLIADVCTKAFCAGHRGDLALALGTKALAAFRNKSKVDLKEVMDVRDLALLHRLRNLQQEQQEQQNENQQEEQEQNNESSQNEKKEEDQDQKHSLDQEMDIPPMDFDLPKKEEQTQKEELFDMADAYQIGNILETDKDKLQRSKGSGKRSKTKTNLKMGRYVKVKHPKGKIEDLAFDATLRAAAPFQKIRKSNDLKVIIEPSDFRKKVREKRIGNTILFLVDASGSMGVQKRMIEAKTAVFSLLQDAYKKRDRVALMSFRGEEAEMLLPPTRSIDLAYKKLQDIKTGGRTPLALALDQMMSHLKALGVKDKELLPVIVLLTDGKANWVDGKTNPLESAYKKAEELSNEPVKIVLVDTETGFLKLGLGSNLAQKMEADYIRLDQLRAGELAQKVKEILN